MNIGDVKVPGYWQFQGGAAQRIDNLRVGCGVKDGALGWFVTYPVSMGAQAGEQVKTEFIPAPEALTMTDVLMLVDTRWAPLSWVMVDWPPLEMLARADK